ncbi:hypothetical protein [Alcanivorax sp.]|jgi:hypothetical protein|uniref:hypothetical protein n=1 Tax=Alcanivorax sp. TaxID=1872427 RepID=UPI0032D9A8FB
MLALYTLGLFILTAVTEIVGCYLPYLWLKKSAPGWVLLPAAASLAMFAWLLSLHPWKYLGRLEFRCFNSLPRSRLVKNVLAMESGRMSVSWDLAPCI